jgi:hypothetical protein
VKAHRNNHLASLLLQTSALRSLREPCDLHPDDTFNRRGLGQENDRPKRSGKINLGTDIKAVWIASVPRCGSMWVFNVTRRIARDAGLEVLPTPVPQTDKAMLAAYEEGVRDPAIDRVRVLKVHSALRSDLAASRFILPRRDIRDSVVSFMRFNRCDFEQAMKFVPLAIELQRHFDSFPRDGALMIDYPDIIARPAYIAHAIARFLELPLARQTTRAIAGDLSKEKVAALIARKEREVICRLREGCDVPTAELVVLGPQNWRVFDTDTGFQSGHTSDYQEGGWKSILTEEQKSRLETVIRTCNAHSA